MARILYTVCGVGLGHCMRSMPLIEELEKNGHEILLSSYSTAFEFLKKKFENSKSIQLFDILEGSDNEKLLKIVVYEVSIEPNSLGKNFLRLLKEVKKFRPQIIISDFDLYSSIIGFLLDIPVVLISNMHISEYYQIEMNLQEKIKYSLKDRSILYSFPRIDKMVLINFFEPKRTPKNVNFFFYPIRKEISSLKQKEKDFFLVYFSENELEKIMPVLKHFREKKFVVFSGKKLHTQENIEVRPLEKQEFARLFSECKGVLSHAGITVISEAVFLHKPLYLFTKKSFFERHYNSKVVMEKNFGYAESTPTISGLNHYFSNLDSYKKSIRSAGFVPQSKKMTKHVLKLVKSIAKPALGKAF